METTDTIGRGWYGVIIVPKKQKDESFHDKAMRKAAKIIVQTRPDLAIGDFGKPVRERDHKVAFVLDSSGNIMVPKKRKNETRGDKAARKAAEMAVSLQMVNTTRIREDSGSNALQNRGVVDLAGDHSGSIVVPKKRKGETSEEKAARKAAKKAYRLPTANAHGLGQGGHKLQRKGPTEGQRTARNEARRGRSLEGRLAGKEREGAWESAAFVSNRYGALPALEFAGDRALRPNKETMVKKCSDCGENNDRHWYWGTTIHGTWVLTCSNCYQTRYNKRWRKSWPESRNYIDTRIGQDPVHEQLRQAITGNDEAAQVNELVLRDGEAEENMSHKRKVETAEQRSSRNAAGQPSRSLVPTSEVDLDAHKQRDRKQEEWYLATKRRRREQREAAAAAAQGGEELQMFGLGRNQHGNKGLPLRPRKSVMVQECVQCGSTESSCFRGALQGGKTWVLVCNQCYKRAYRAEKGDCKRTKKNPQAYHGARSDYIFQGKLDNVPY
ncbi:hypothetical protein CKM354_001241500 [Cercospora kikuchii]|uniref:Uncharacterized protein n=1 Tax=Cercospora kikuchii TaxID=84275 RepID=A0A9P3FLY6_9PEZI|nr:uncharacterized protein CKM354_001241500 [Cercospora kikuchii]GIZ49385.1 hypothetical protein CKM354_001241500 [Cercospora kikuchii]